MEIHFKEKLNTLFSHIVEPGKLIVDEDIRALIFGDFITKSKGDERQYDEIQNLKELREVDGTFFLYDLFYYDDIKGLLFFF